jgi:acylphosphatase
MIQYRVIVDGRVQGVGFRASTAREVVRYPGLKGWVRNLPDGKVEAVFCGEDSDVKKMVEWCRHGPSLARVLSFVANEEPCDNSLVAFKIVARVF